MKTAALKKILIKGYADPKCVNEPVDTISAIINPEKLNRDFKIEYYPSKGLGQSGVTQRFARMESAGIEFDLFVDGSGVIPIPAGCGKDVDSYIRKLKGVIYQYKGKAHRPNYLKIAWGGWNFVGVCESISINYTLFSPDGSALRAIVKMKFLKSTDFKTKLKESQKSSPDLTHQVTVKAGDNLPLMCQRIYGDPSYYLEVAKVNGIKSFLALTPGDQVFFPPLKK